MVQIDETLIRSVVEQVLSRMNGSGRAGAPAAAIEGRFGMFTDVDQAVAAAREAFEQLSGMTLDDRRRIIDHIRRISIEQCVELGTMEMEETKIGRLRAQDRKAQDAGRADAGRRVPAQRGLQRRSRPGGHRARPLRRDRRHHAGHALAAHDHRQRRQHDRRRQHAGRQSASQRQDAWRPRACAASTRRSTATWASTT